MCVLQSHFKTSKRSSGAAVRKTRSKGFGLWANRLTGLSFLGPLQPASREQDFSHCADCAWAQCLLPLAFGTPLTSSDRPASFDAHPAMHAPLPSRISSGCGLPALLRARPSSGLVGLREPGAQSSQDQGKAWAAQSMRSSAKLLKSLVLGLVFCMLGSQSLFEQPLPAVRLHLFLGYTKQALTQAVQLLPFRKWDPQLAYSMLARLPDCRVPERRQ